MEVKATRNRLFNESGGFTTVGAAVALLLVLALLFASMQAYWVGVHSGDIQYVADAGALAADDAIADFVMMGQLIDALLLSMTLFGLSVYVVSAVVSFIPGGEGLAAQHLDVGERVFASRDRFADSATKGLNSAQKALPALCAVKAAACVQANATASGIGYQGMAVSVPTSAAAVSLQDDAEVEESADAMASHESDAAQESKGIDAAQAEADASKERAWYEDCGGTGMTMRERAEHLAQLPVAFNPGYPSAEVWHFSAALERAKAYYRARYAQEPGENFDGAPEEVAESIARKHFYAYALATVSKGSAGVSSDGTESPDLKRLARNTEQIKNTSLYTERIYPVSRLDGKRVIHAYGECPGCKEGSFDGYASLSDVDSGKVEVCPYCKFCTKTMGRVPSASTSISNGFEYHYLAVVEEAERYSRCMQEVEKARGKLKEVRSKMQGALEKALKSLVTKRYDPQPPGRYGCVCIVFAPPTGKIGQTTFAKTGVGSPARVAVSAATLAADDASDGSDVMKSLESRLDASGVVGSSLGKVLLRTWSGMLGAYEAGNKGISDGVQAVLSAIPLVGNDLSAWALDGMQQAISEAGLKPAQLHVFKPVLVNTTYVLQADQSSFAQSLLNLKQQGAYAARGLEVFSDAIETLKGTSSAQELSQAGATIASIELDAFGIPSAKIPLNLPIPGNLSRGYEQLLSQLEGVLAAAS